MDQVLQFFRENGQSVYRHNDIAVVRVSSEQDGVALTLPLFEEIFDKQTILYLSGGRTPKNLYAAMSQEDNLHPGAFAMVDERFGMPMHENSNEKMLRDSGLFRYMQMRNIPFYPMLNSKSREEAAEDYDQTVRTFLAQYQKHIAILGVGMDGHTAGIPSQISNLKSQKSKPDWMKDLYERAKNRMVIDYDDSKGFYKERITMTFQGLSMMDLLIVLVFGRDKLPALQAVFSEGPEEEIPGRFLKRPEIAKKTLLITDQEVV